MTTHEESKGEGSVVIKALREAEHSVEVSAEDSAARPEVSDAPAGEDGGGEV